MNYGIFLYSILTLTSSFIHPFLNKIDTTLKSYISFCQDDTQLLRLALFCDTLFQGKDVPVIMMDSIKRSKIEVITDLGFNNVTIVEKNHFKVSNHRRHTNYTVVHGDILQYIRKTNSKFSIVIISTNNYKDYCENVFDEIMRRKLINDAGLVFFKYPSKKSYIKNIKKFFNLRKTTRQSNFSKIVKKLNSKYVDRNIISLSEEKCRDYNGNHVNYCYYYIKEKNEL